MDTQRLGISLRAAFGEVPDPRARRGQRHPLAAVLTLMTVAMLSGARSLYAIAQWGRLQDPEVVMALGFTSGRTPAVSTLHEVTRRLDPTALEGVLARWVQGAGVAAGSGIALDGKVLRGSHPKGAPPSQWIDVVAAYTHEAGRVLAQAGGERGQTRGRIDGGTSLAGPIAAAGSGDHR